MPLNRRQFFGQFWGDDNKRLAERRARCEALEGYAWTNLLPYDFALNDEQYRELEREIRDFLARTSDDDLHSMEMTRRLEEVVHGLIDPWRQEYYRNSGSL
ncbi:MAG TPA: hypothetical protein VFY29_04590 [Terriglobia bacterium]|nr:hypothetical protein [Terriglobia bacterium]